MRYRLSVDRIDRTQTDVKKSIDVVISQAKWRVEFQYSDGGFKESFDFGQGEGTVTGFSFKTTEKGNVTASITVGPHCFYIDTQDIVLIYRRGVLMFRGYITATPEDQEGGTIKATSFQKKLAQIRYNGSFTGSTIREILETVLTATAADTGILYNAALLDVDDTSTRDYNSDYDTVKKVTDDMTALETDGRAFIHPAGFFSIKKRESTITHSIFASDDDNFVTIRAKRDAGRVNKTRQQVFQKSGSGSAARIGQVGYGAGYATQTALENEFGKIEAKVTVNEDLSTSDGLDLAFEQVRAQTVEERVQIVGLDYDEHAVDIFERVEVFAPEKYSLVTISNGEQTDGAIESGDGAMWRGSVSLSSDSVKGDGAITWSASDFVYLDLGEVKRFSQKGITYVIMDIKSSSLAGSFLQVDLATELPQGYSSGTYSSDIYSGPEIVPDPNNLFNENTPIAFRTVGSYETLKIPFSGDYRYIGFRRKPGSTATSTITVDRISNYMIDRKRYEGNVISMDWKIDPFNDDGLTVTIGEMDEKADDRLFSLEAKVAELEKANI
jgi:hypothetical protein